MVAFVSAPGVASQPSLPPYVGQVGCRTMFPSETGAVATLMSRRGDFARDNITSLQLVFANFYIAGDGTETGGGAGRQIEADVEYPVGVKTRVKFSGANTGVMTDGQARMISDPVAIIIPRGAQFWVNTWCGGLATMIYMHERTANAAMGDTVAFGVASQAGQAWAGSGSNVWYGPSAIIAKTTRDAVAVFGDSREAGLGALKDQAIYPGSLHPVLARTNGILNMARAGTQTQQITSGKLAKYPAYVSQAIIELGINDITNSRTAGQPRSCWQTGSLSVR